VHLSGGELVLHIGEQQAETARRLREEAQVAQSWAIVTPCNPASAVLDPGQNAARLEQLKRQLQLLEQRCIPSVNRDPDGGWPDEAGFLLCDPPPGTAESLGRHFGQNAIVVGELDSPPRLVWLTSAKS
jgi:hypothetical protein